MGVDTQEGSHIKRSCQLLTLAMTAASLLWMQAATGEEPPGFSSYLLHSLWCCEWLRLPLSHQPGHAVMLMWHFLQVP